MTTELTTRDRTDTLVTVIDEVFEEEKYSLRHSNWESARSNSDEFPYQLRRLDQLQTYR